LNLLQHCVSRRVLTQIPKLQLLNPANLIHQRRRWSSQFGFDRDVGEELMRSLRERGESEPEPKSARSRELFEMYTHILAVCPQRVHHPRPKLPPDGEVSVQRWRTVSVLDQERVDDVETVGGWVLVFPYERGDESA